MQQDQLTAEPARVGAPLPGPVPSTTVRRARAGLVVLAAVLTELALVAGLCNQAVTRSFAHYVAGRQTSLPDYSLGTVRSVATFGWSFAPLHGESNAVWGSQFAAIAVLLALSALLVLAVSRGPVTFFRVFFAVWGVVAAVTAVAVVVRGLVAGPATLRSNTSRLGDALFHDVDGAVIVAGLGLGLVVGLVAAIVAVTTRRPTEVSADPPPRTDEADEVYSPEQLLTPPALDEPSDRYAPQYGASALATSGSDAPGYATTGYGSQPWQQAGPDHAAAVNAHTAALAPIPPAPRPVADAGSGAAAGVTESTDPYGRLRE
jgi:hypothetical protein